MAAAATLAMFVGLTGYACFTKHDITMKGGLLTTAGMMVFIFTLFFFIMGGNTIWHMIICVVVIMLLSVYIVYDTQIIVGGKHKKF